jgi:hypothetical protein
MNPSGLESALRRAGELSRAPGSIVERVMCQIAADPLRAQRPQTASAGIDTRTHTHWRLFMRIGIPASIAACLLVAAGLWLVPTRVASAAEQLQEVVATNQAYPGWVHATMLPPTEMPQGLPPGVKIPARGIWHSNAAEGIAAEVKEFEKGADVTFYSTTRHEQLTYDHTTNELRAATLTDLGMQAARQMAMSPTTVAEMLALRQKSTDRQPVSVKSTPEGNGTRFDVVFFNTQEELDAYAKKYGDGTPRAITIWVNAEKFMTRVRFEDVPSRTYTVDITYGKPEFHDIYDLGVPRDAKLIDKRLAPSPSNETLAQLSTRLKDRRQKGFGNYTAFVSHYDENADGTAAPDSGYFTIFAVKDAKWLIASYRLMSAPRPGRGQTPGTVLTQAPEGWPTPDLQKLLPILLQAPPTEFWVWDGKTGCQGSYDSNAGKMRAVTVIAGKVAPHEQEEMGLTGRWVWPIPSALQQAILENITLLQDDTHPKLLGIRTHTDPDPKRGLETTGDSTIWYDPARDDVAVETDYQSVPTQGAPVPSTRSQTKYLEFAQLEGSKRWYPTHWQETYTSTNPRTRQAQTSTSHYRLQFVPTLKLADEWFQDPRPRLEKAVQDKASMP